MKAKGIRIYDKKNGCVTVDLLNIIEEIEKGDSYHWSILHLYAMGHLGEGISIVEFEKQIYDSENGVFIDWEDLKSLAKKFNQIFDITLIGCEDKNLLHRYESDQKMYETCDIVVEMIDSSYWEIFSKNEELINKFATKYTEIEFLTPNWNSQTETKELDKDEGLTRKIECTDEKIFFPNQIQKNNNLNKTGVPPRRSVSEPLPGWDYE